MTLHIKQHRVHAYTVIHTFYLLSSSSPGGHKFNKNRSLVQFKSADLPKCFSYGMTTVSMRTTEKNIETHSL